METKDGYYSSTESDNISYPHDPASEKALFRDAILDRINDEQIVGIEIGVLDGETSRFLLGIDKRIHLLGIDPIIPDSMETSLIGSEEKIEANVAEYGDRWVFKKAYSYDVASDIPEDSYDFIFIDGDHTYDAVKQDYKMYYPAIKKGGLIFFHDSRMNRGGAPFHVGSSAFVDELIEYSQVLELIGEAFSLTCFRKK